MASILWLPVVFASCSSLLYWLSMSLPALPTEGLSVNSTALKFPSTLEELQALATLLEHYRLHHMSYVLALYSTAYLFKQAFAIPGSIFLNLLGGALFGQWMGFFLTCVLSASGATFCFLLAKVCGRSYIVKYFPDKLQLINSKIEQNADSLFFFLMFLRLFPMTPNWFLNMASPICGVPAHLFFLSVFFGLMPYNFISVQTGCLLSQLTSMDKVFTPWTMLKLFAMATAALVPGLCIKKYQEYRSNKKRQQEAARENAAIAAKSAEKVEVRNTKARKRLAFQARSKSTDESRGGEVDPEFYNMLVDQHYAVRQKMQQVVEEKGNEAPTGYCERTAENQESIAERIVEKAEMIDDKDLQEGEVALTETSIPDRTKGVGIDLANRNSDCVEELLHFERQGVEELKFSAKAEPNAGVKAAIDDNSLLEHEEMSNSETEYQKESKPNGQRVEDVERASEDEASSVRITNGHFEESGKSVQQKTEHVADAGNKDLIDTLLDQENGVDDKVEFCEDVLAEDNHIGHYKDGQTVVAAKNDDISIETEPHEEKVYKTPSADQELPTVPSEVVADVEAKSKQEVASSTVQNDDISTQTEPQEEKVCKAPAMELELPTVASEVVVDELTKTEEKLGDIASSTAQNDGISAESKPHEEKVCKAPATEQELPTVASEVVVDEVTKTKEELADITSSTQEDDISADADKAQVCKPDEKEDGANKSDKIPEDLTALDVNDVQEVELKSKAEKVNGKEGEGNILQDEASGIEVQRDMKSASTKDEPDSAEDRNGEDLPESALNESAPNGAKCQDDPGAKHANCAKSPSAKVNGEDLIQDKTEQSASSAVEARTVIGTSTADSNSQ